MAGKKKGYTEPPRPKGRGVPFTNHAENLKRYLRDVSLELGEDVFVATDLFDFHAAQRLNIRVPQEYRGSEMDFFRDRLDKYSTKTDTLSAVPRGTNIRKVFTRSRINMFFADVYGTVPDAPLKARYGE